MKFSEYLNQGGNIAPVGPFVGDRRMDQVEEQRGLVYGVSAAPGYICYEDGSCITVEEANRRAGNQIVVPVRRPRTAREGDTSFAAMLANRMAGQDERSYHSTTYPEPSPARVPHGYQLFCTPMGGCRYLPPIEE